MSSGAERDTVSGTPELTVSGLTVRFGALTALEGVSLALRAGEVVALAGENGAGKTTLIRSVAGDVTPVSGSIRVGGQAVAPVPSAAAKLGVRVVWQDLALADNLDVAANVMLGNERRRHLFSEVALHKDAARLLDRLGIPLQDTMRPVRLLSGGQRQMVAVARAMAHNPRILLLDEPTASLAVREAALVERLITRLRAQGTTILLSGHDTELMFRLADRIIVLRHGRVVTEVSPSEVHPDDVVALVSGQPVDSSARFQLTRLHGLAGRLVAADPSSSLSLILSALGAALGSERLAIHLLEDGSLVRAASLGMPEALLTAWERLPVGAAGGPVGLAAERQVPVIEENLRAGGGSWQVFGNLARPAKVASSWSVPVLGPGGLLGVITVFRAIPGKPRRDDLDLAALYAGYAASAIERDQLLDEVTARNRLLETIREMLQTLAGPVPVESALRIALQALRHGLGADEVVLVAAEPDGATLCRGYSSAAADWRDGAGDPAGTAGHRAPATENGRAAARRRRPSPRPARSSSGGTRTASRSPARPASAPCARAAASSRTGPGAGTCRSPSPCPTGGPCCSPAGRTAPGRTTRPTCLKTRRTRCGSRSSASGRCSPSRRRWRCASHASSSGRSCAGSATSCAPRSPRSPGTRPACCSRTSPGTRTRSSGSCPASPPSPRGSAAWSTTCSTSPRSSRASCGSTTTGATSRSSSMPRSPSCPRTPRPRSRSRTRPGCPPSGPTTTGWSRCSSTCSATRSATTRRGRRWWSPWRPTGPGAVAVRVADDGEGLPAELARAVTQAAGQRDPRWHDVLASGTIRPRRRGSGAGLGLSIASGIVAAHGGRLELEPTERGTCFLVTLPVEKPVTMPSSRPAPGAGDPTATTSSGVKARD